MQLWFVSQLNLKHFGEIMRLSDAMKKHLDFPGGSDSKASACNAVRSLGWEHPLEKEMATHSILLPGESHGWRSLVGYIVHVVTKSWT